MLHGARSYLLQDEDGQTIESPLDLAPAWTTPASAPSTPACTTSAGPSTAPVTDAEAMEAFALLCRTEGIIPAIESRARARRRAATSAASSARTALLLVNLSGRGDKDVDTAAAWFGLHRRTADAAEPTSRAAAEAVAVRTR